MSTSVRNPLSMALLDLQANPPELLKDARNPHFKNTYISLGAVLNAVLPELNKRGVVLLQPVTQINGEPALETRLVHAESGEEISTTMMLVLDRDTPQGQGSAITYARRYGLLSILGFNADEDDDAEAATAVRKPKRASANGKAKARVVVQDDDDEETPW